MGCGHRRPQSINMQKPVTKTMSCIAVPVYSRCQGLFRLICITRRHIDPLPSTTRLLHRRHMATTASSPPTVPSTDLRSYTSRRWLLSDKAEQEARYIDFDLAALQAKVIKLCSGAKAIVQCERRDGGYNRALLFACDNGQRVVARLPTKRAGPPRLTTNSEVATIAYRKSRPTMTACLFRAQLTSLVKRKTSMPIPDILEWNDDPANPVGSEFIIMTWASGAHMLDQWPTILAPDRIKCIGSIFESLREAFRLDFSAYGNLYFEDAPIASNSKIPIGDGFCLGPACSTRFWDYTIENERPDINLRLKRGPCMSLRLFPGLQR